LLLGIFVFLSGMKKGISRYIANRFSQSNKRSGFLNFARTVAFISVMLGSMALIISLSVLEGFDKMLRENAIKFTSHISVRGFDNKPVLNYQRKIDSLIAIPEIMEVAPVFKREGLIRTKNYVEGVQIRGFSPEHDINGLSGNIIKGLKEFSERNEILIGNRLAKKLGVDIGDNVVVYAVNEFSPEGMPSPEIDKFVVQGIFETGMAKYDDLYVYIPEEKAQEFFNIAKGNASNLEIMLHDVNNAGMVATRVDDLLGYPYYTYTVFELHSAIFTWIEIQKEPIPIVLGLISIVAVLSIITILLISVVEKTKSIGILRSLGMQRSGILKIFIYQGFSVGFAGTIAGCLVGLGLGWLQQTYKIIALEGKVYVLDSLPVYFEFWHFYIVIGVSLFFTLLATLLPAWIASKVSPLKALRYK
jgi:lipoprotein-releasing system permease protein